MRSSAQLNPVHLHNHKRFCSHLHNRKQLGVLNKKSRLINGVNEKRKIGLRFFLVSRKFCLFLSFFNKVLFFLSTFYALHRKLTYNPFYIFNQNKHFYNFKMIYFRNTSPLLLPTSESTRLTCFSKRAVDTLRRF